MRVENEKKDRDNFERRNFVNMEKQQMCADNGTVNSPVLFFTCSVVRQQNQKKDRKESESHSPRFIMYWCLSQKGWL